MCSDSQENHVGHTEEVKIKKYVVKLHYYLQFQINFHIGTTDILLKNKNYSQEVKKGFKIFPAPGHYPTDKYKYTYQIRLI